jgi:hypothetical protein
MKHLFENLLSISVFFSPFPFIFSQNTDAGESIPKLSAEELMAVEDMSLKINSPIKNTIEELVDANVRADSKNPDRFKPKTSIELKTTVFNINSMTTTSSWGQITIILQPHNVDKNEKWTEECNIKFYIGFNGCLKTGQMLMFKGSAICATLENEKEQSVLFFLPGDICKRYGLNRTPDYCAVRFTTDGISQDIIIINKDGKNAYQPNPEDFHAKAKERSDIRPVPLRNADQLPSYADIKIKNHPSLIPSAQ